jgi:transglutaminase-like putative cysteine protease
MNKEPVSFEQLPGMCVCFALVLAAHYDRLPGWVLLIASMCIAIRLILALSGRGAPSQPIMIGITVLSIALLFMRFRTFNGLAAGTALLALTSALKLLETKTRRDIYIVTLGIYFLCVAALLNSESFWLFAYLIVVAWLATLALLRATTRRPLNSWGQNLRYGLRLLLQAAPLAIAFWLLFPRLNSPLWQLQGAGDKATSGLSDSMSPGDITDLAQSDEVAFRVHFKGPAPAPREQYWRGPVLHDFDGRAWRRSLQMGLSGMPTAPTGPEYRYTVSMEPHSHNWVYALDWPTRFALPHGTLTADYTLVQPTAVDQPIDVAITSRPVLPADAGLAEAERRRDLKPGPGNPRTRELARQMRTANADDWALVLAVLKRFAQESYFYTLTPPGLGVDSVDQFLFDTRRGFCGHYASAFAVLMRDAGVPTRVVTGYQGGTYNRFGDYWIVRQREAHAWDEVWINGRGWVRIDPTSMIDPSRVEQSVNDDVAADEPLTNRWQRRWRWFSDARLRLDELSQLWRERFLTFNQDSQQQLLEWMHIPDPDMEKLVLLLAGSLALAFGWLTWQVRRELDIVTRDPVQRSYARLCRKLAHVGLARAEHEGPLDYAERVLRQRPDLGQAVGSLTRHYVALRYAGAATPTAKDFEQAVRRFRPSRAGASGS